MANLIQKGTDGASGQEKLLASADVFADATGTPILQEVVDARGSFGSLNARLNNFVSSSGLLEAKKTDGVTKVIQVNNTGLAFFAATPIAKPTVTGVRGSGNTALANLLTQLANLGLITDSTTET